MNSKQISIIKGTAKQFDATMFYDKLFAIAPETKALFNFATFEEQKAKLVRAIGFVVKSVDRFEQVIPELQRLGIRHVGYGVKPEHYSFVGEALLFALNLTHPDQVHAWQTAYELIANTMVEAAKEVPPLKEGES